MKPTFNEKILPKISIITPSYNQGKFLEETIQSVLSQNYPNLEYIIIDGGSDDNSVEIIKKYEKYLAYWESKKDKGQAHAINKGFQKSTGEIIAWLNSDDTYLPHVLEKVNTFFTNNENCKWIAGNVFFTDENGTIISKKKSLYSPFILRYASSSLYQQSVFLRRDILNEIGYLNESMHFLMDQEWFCRISEKYETAIINLNVALFRWHKKSKSSLNKSHNFKEYLKEKRTIIETYQPGLKFYFDMNPKLTLRSIENFTRLLKVLKRLTIRRFNIS